MTDLPAPLTPADCDLRGYEYMPMFGNRLFGSEFYARATDAEFRAAMRLWWSAWQQCPAGSLPDDDRALALMADFGRDVKGFRKVRGEALHGFVKCNDGRLYHPLLCNEAMIVSAMRKKERVRKAIYREKNGGSGGTQSFEVNDLDESVPRDTTGTSASHPPDVHPYLTGEEKKEREVRKEGEQHTPTSTPACVPATLPACVISPFEEFWNAYPSQEGGEVATRRAYAAAISGGATHAEIMAGVKRMRVPSDPQFIPFARNWIKDGRYREKVARKRHASTWLELEREAQLADLPGEGHPDGH